MSYCQKHNCNNCLECAIEKQTQVIIETLNGLKMESVIDKITPPIPPIKDGQWYQIQMHTDGTWLYRQIPLKYILKAPVTRHPFNWFTDIFRGLKP